MEDEIHFRHLEGEYDNDDDDDDSNNDNYQLRKNCG